MTITFGRRRLIVALVGAPPHRDRKAFTYPMADNASDAELARLNVLNIAAVDQRRWEMAAALYGGPWPR